MTLVFKVIVQPQTQIFWHFHIYKNTVFAISKMVKKYNFLCQKKVQNLQKRKKNLLETLGFFVWYYTFFHDSAHCAWLHVSKLISKWLNGLPRRWTTMHTITISSSSTWIGDELISCRVHKNLVSSGFCGWKNQQATPKCFMASGFF